MKKIILALGLAVALISCKKENPQPNEPQQNCSCGTITSVSLHHPVYNPTIRSVNIKNYCSGSTKTVWPTAAQLASRPHHIGAEWCDPLNTGW
jgi:hypothetical protein